MPGFALLDAIAARLVPIRLFSQASPFGIQPAVRGG
jgi:hypothetical protein